MPVFKTGAINHSATSPRLHSFAAVSILWQASKNGSPRPRMRALFRRGCSLWRAAGGWGFGHFHRPDRGGTHVHRGTEIAITLVGLGRSEPISFALIDNVVDA